MTPDITEQPPQPAPVVDVESAWADDGSDVDCESSPRQFESLCVGEAR